MAGPNPYKLHSFAEWRHFGPIFARCDSCRRFVVLPARQEPFGDRDARHTTMSCSVCGEVGRLSDEDPRQIPAYADYRRDDWTAPARHPAAIERLTRVPESRRPAQAFVPPKLRHQHGRR